jgi:hypothetical protein
VSKIPLGFDPNTIRVPLDNLLPSRKIAIGLLQSKKYQQILASIREVGVIEPLSVIAADAAAGTYLLLDGHVRIVAMRELGYTEANCLIAKDDEGYTYNTRINRVSTIQEHRMIRRAIDRGVSSEKVANTLGVDVSLIHKKATMLDGICDEAIEMLKDRQFSTNVTAVLKRMKPMRQVQCVELMIDCNKFTSDYANALLALTPPDMLVEARTRASRPASPPSNLHAWSAKWPTYRGNTSWWSRATGRMSSISCWRSGIWRSCWPTRWWPGISGSISRRCWSSSRRSYRRNRSNSRECEF